MDDLDGALTAVKGRWMTGAPGLDAAPAAWRAVIGAEEDSELRLLALAGHALQTVFRPIPPAPLTPAAPLPKLALPFMPEPARMRLRALIAAHRPDAASMAPIATLVAARGWAVHPMDWTPPVSAEGLPDLYAPLIDWLNRAESADEALTAETWSNFAPAARQAALTDLRRRDPAAALALIAEQAGGEAADVRLGCVTILAEGLSEADAEYLSSLSKDRSGKVKALAATLRARLGQEETEEEAVAELLDTLTFAAAGLINRKKVLSPKKLKNDAQRRQRRELFEVVPLPALAKALDLESAEAVERWRFGEDDQTDAAFVAMAFATGPDAAMPRLTERLIETDLTGLIQPAFADRLPRPERRRLAEKALAVGKGSFGALLLATPELGGFSLEAIRAAPSWRETVAMAEEAAKAEKTNWSRAVALTAALRHIGLLADPAAAQALLDAMTACGLPLTDPNLHTLRLNAALEMRL